MMISLDLWAYMNMGVHSEYCGSRDFMNLIMFMGINIKKPADIMAG
jgi:hypothetical protein